MKKIGTNALRIYQVEADLDHDECMQVFADAGIYTFIDLDTLDTYLYSDSGGGRWTEEQFDKFTAVMDTFHDYDNVAGFFVANELLNFGAASVGAPYIKAAAVDMKNYRDKQGYRNITIGYSAADITDLRPNLQNYMACGNPSEALDFYSLNAYEWYGETTYVVSGYSALQANTSDYNIPIWFSEVGCNAVRPRTFGDQEAIFSEPMVDTWSGSMVYEWIQEQNDYGLILYGPPAGTATGENVIAGFTRAGTPAPVTPDFENLSSQWATLSPTGVNMNEYKPSLSPVACPYYTEGFWEVTGTGLPTIGTAYTSGPNTQSTGSLTTTSREGGGSSGRSGDGMASQTLSNTGSSSGVLAGSSGMPVSSNTTADSANTASITSTALNFSGASSTLDSTGLEGGAGTRTDESTSDSDDSNSDSEEVNQGDGESAAGLGYRASAAATIVAGLMAVIVFVL